MLRYITQRIFFIVPVALFVCFITFMIIHLVPGDPARVLLGPEASTESQIALDQQLGLNKPILTQFVLWFWQALHGNLGESIQLQQPVLQAIIQRLPVTVELGVVSLFYSLALAIPLGIYTSTHRNSRIDWLVNVISLFFSAIPPFILGLLLMVFLTVNMHLFPPGGYVPFSQDPLGNLRDLILPVLTLGTGAVAANLRQIRSSMIDTLNQDYVRTARAKGLAENRVFYIHALRNAMLPVLTIIGLQVGSILAGTVVVETIFLWPGIGQLVVQSLFSKDYPIVQGVVLLAAFSYTATNLLTDIGYAILDPRIHFNK
jgi:peptide/nickel transport system permease protein